MSSSSHLITWTLHMTSKNIVLKDYNIFYDFLLFVGSQSTMYNCGFPEQVIKDHTALKYVT